MFSASVLGAESSANSYSIIEVAKTNGLDPYKFLTTIFTYLPNQDLIKNPEIIDGFLTWSEFVQSSKANNLKIVREPYQNFQRFKVQRDQHAFIINTIIYLSDKFEIAQITLNNFLI